MISGSLNLRIESFKLRLGANRDCAEFGSAVDLIRRELEHRGFYLTVREQRGNGCAEPETLAEILLRKKRRGIDKLCRAMNLDSIREKRPELVRGLSVGQDAKVMPREGFWKVPLVYQNRVVDELRLSGDGTKVV